MWVLFRRVLRIELKCTLRIVGGSESVLCYLSAVSVNRFESASETVLEVCLSLACVCKVHDEVSKFDGFCSCEYRRQRGLQVVFEYLEEDLRDLPQRWYVKKRRGDVLLYGFEVFGPVKEYFEDFTLCGGEETSAEVDSLDFLIWNAVGSCSFVEFGLYFCGIEAVSRDFREQLVYHQPSFDGGEVSTAKGGCDSLDKFFGGGFSSGECVTVAEVFDEPVPFELEDVDGGFDELVECVFAC